MCTVRTLVVALSGALYFAASASATNVALLSFGATATANDQLTFSGITYSASNAIDGTGCPSFPSCNSLNEWVAPGLSSSNSVEPWLLINIGQTLLIDSVTVDGIGNSGLFTSFDIFVGTLAALQNIETNGAGAAGAGATLLLQVTNQLDGSPWSLTGTVPGGGYIATQYVLYEATNDTVMNSSNCAGNSCYPGSALFNTDNSPLTGQDDAFASAILVNEVPEPTTVGLVSLSLLALGFARRRFCKQ